MYVKLISRTKSSDVTCTRPISLTKTKRMKYRITLIILLVVNCVFAQDYYTEFLHACESTDTTKQIEILTKWEKLEPSNPELFTCRFNYHFKNSQQEVLELKTGEPQGDALVLQDSLGNSAGYMESKIIYDSLELGKAFKYIDRGIELNPERLDMRFGKTYVYGQLNNWDKFTSEIIETVRHSSSKSKPWLWTNNEQKEGDNEFMLSAIQDYQLQLYNSGDDSLLLKMRQIANAILSHYPNHIESLSNLSITYTLLGEFEKALEPLKKAESINPDDYIVIANIANTYKEMANKEKAIEYYNKLMKFDVEGVAEFAKQQIDKLEKE